MIRLHVVGLPHTSTTTWWSPCAFTGQLMRFVSGMTDHGSTVYLYAGPYNEARVAEHIPLVSLTERDEWWPGWDPNEQVWDGYDPTAPWWHTFNKRAISAIAERIEPKDIIAITGGRASEEIIAAFPDHLVVEWGVGYEGICTKFRCFPSYSWMHYIYGLRGITDGAWYDTVIPHSYESGEFRPVRRPEGGYLLYLGRMTERKGLEVVRELAKKYRVITAGQDNARVEGAEHAGVVRGLDRLKLLQNADALVLPTSYIEPFGCVVIEAALCGTPAITTDWGAFTETVIEKFTGYRCRTLKEFHQAVSNLGMLDREFVALSAQSRFTTDSTIPAYQRWFERLGTLHGKGWYS
jgi:Glycosyl transferases group 1